MGVDTGRATTRALPPHPLPARPYYTANRPAKPVYSRGRGGCGCGEGALVAARPRPPLLFSLFEMYWGQALPLHFDFGNGVDGCGDVDVFLVAGSC